MDKKYFVEISRLVVGIIAVRLVQNDDAVYFEKIEANKWIQISPAQLQELSSDKKIQNWINKCYELINNSENRDI